MRTLSQRCKYGLRALCLLAREYRQGPAPIARIAASEHIPRKFLEAILVQLRDRGLVDSRMGKKGGYSLAKPPASITIGAIVRAIDGPFAPLPCAGETANRQCPECVEEADCETRIVMREVRDAVAMVLDRTTLAALCARAANGAALTYDI